MSRRFFSPLVPVAGVLLATAAVLIASVPDAGHHLYLEQRRREPGHRWGRQLEPDWRQQLGQRRNLQCVEQ